MSEMHNIDSNYTKQQFNENKMADEIDWKQNWIEERIGKSGGQGASKIVKRKNTANTEHFFLKILNKQDDDERRKRMHREVTAYSTLDHPNVPKLVDSNSHHFADQKFKLYLVTSFIEGQTLEELIETNGPLPLDTAIELVLSLTSTVAYCHREDCLHRDIKPDNIVLHKDALNPVLVDFGLSFNTIDETDLRTEIGREIGNRFLRLPELGINSSNKRDPRTDVASICGILFYVLTAQLPATLLDAEGRLPHQRPNVTQRLEVLSQMASTLRPIFDRGFQVNINERWASAEELHTTLEALKTQMSQPVNIRNGDAIMQEVLAELRMSTLQSSGKYKQILEACLKSVDEQSRRVTNDLFPSITSFGTNYVWNMPNLSVLTTFGIVRADGRGEIRINYETSIVGSEVLIKGTVEGNTTELLRTDVADPRLSQAYDEKVYHLVISEVQRLLSLA